MTSYVLVNLVKLSVIFLNIIAISLTWDLSSHGINNNYFASSIAIFKNRAFLTLPRSSCYNDIFYPTVIEVPWVGERSTKVRKRIEFPTDVVQVWGECIHVQDAVSVVAQEEQGKLWILDAGSDTCNPKVIVYDLNFNVEFQKFQLVGVPHGNLSSLVVDSRENVSLAYVGGEIKNLIIVLSLDDSVWWKVHLHEKSGKDVPTSVLAVSPNEPLLFATTQNEEELFTIQLNNSQYHPENTSIFIEAIYEGSKLGPSGGMVVDLKNGLDYYLTRDYAVVRWDNSGPLQAENHDVLAQSFRALPYVPFMFRGPQDGIWALVNPFSPQECMLNNKSNFTVFHTEHRLRTRVIKLLKYVKKE